MSRILTSPPLDLEPVRTLGMALLSLALAGCGQGGSHDETRAASAETGAAGGATADVPADWAGSFEIGGDSYPFRVVRCDFSGNSPDGMLLRGTGTSPDGRRLSVEVERLAPGEVIWERATMYLGSIVEGDHWTARMGGWPDGRWFADEAGEQPAEGPLLRISGDQLVVEAMFLHESDGTARPGVLRATCPS